MTIIFSPKEINLDAETDSLQILSDDVTDFKWGKSPVQRTIDELLNYGIINLDKPANPTSHEVVSFVKKILNIPRAGHSGTLDPKVTGVLPTALGKATRILDTLLLAGKEYVCNMRLHKDVDEKKIEQIMKDYIGDIYQRPPMRASVKRVLRVRRIYDTEIIEIEERDVLFRISCQAGTYIRKYCLHPETQILTLKGTISAFEFYKSPNTIFSFNNGEVHEKNPSAVQEIVSPSKLIKITMDSGVSFKVTPDHEILKSTYNGYDMTEAADLKAGDYLVKSLEIPFLSEKIVISDLLDDEYLIDQEDIKEKCKDAIMSKYGSIREMSRILNIDRKPFLTNSDISIKIKHLKQAEIYEEVKEQIFRFKTTRGKSLELKELDETFFYLLGLIASDGNNTKEENTKRYTRLIFNNTKKQLIDKFAKLYQKIFPDVDFSIRKDKNDVWCLSTSNSLMATIAASLGIKSPKKESDFSPLLKIESNLLKSYLRGYFDGDGSAYIKKYKNQVKSRISLYTVSKEEALVLHKILLKLKIENKIFSKKRKLNDYNFKIYEVSIGNIGAEHRFIDEIGTNHPDKKNKLKRIRSINQNHEYGDKLHIGLHYHQELVKFKTELKKLMGGNLNRLLNNKLPITRNFYKKASQHVELLPMDNFVIEKIKRVSIVKGTRYVYDMTVPETHNFLIETGYVSSNCHDIGQSLSCGAHMKELRRTKSGPFTEDEFLSSLQDLYDAFSLYKEENNEIPLRNIILPMEYGITHLPKIIVKDSAIDPLCHGAPLGLPGVSKFSKNFTSGELISILSLKHELVAFGETQMNAKDLEEKESGLVASVKRVLMPIGTYQSRKKDIS